MQGGVTLFEGRDTGVTLTLRQRDSGSGGLPKVRCSQGGHVHGRQAEQAAQLTQNARGTAGQSQMGLWSGSSSPGWWASPSGGSVHAETVPSASSPSKCRPTALTVCQRATASGSPRVRVRKGKRAAVRALL
ncbi:hypothetical protein C1708_32035 [Streptomyces sp. DH-12]|nr:hypothetical protein C1708_32035 [Streptomyces sp. DH-12]